MTDLAHHARERVESTMKRYQEQLVHEVDDDLYYLEDDSTVACVQTNHSKILHPGSSLISMDGIHPNDAGYDAWGRIIGQAIVDQWRKDERGE